MIYLNFYPRVPPRTGVPAPGGEGAGHPSLTGRWKRDTPRG